MFPQITVLNQQMEEPYRWHRRCMKDRHIGDNQFVCSEQMNKWTPSRPLYIPVAFSSSWSRKLLFVWRVSSYLLSQRKDFADSLCILKYVPIICYHSTLNFCHIFDHIWLGFSIQCLSPPLSGPVKCGVYFPLPSTAIGQWAGGPDQCRRKNG